MSQQPPPPPPPHGDNPKTSGPNLPKGKYDIFIIPEHSAGSGFLYLPSLQPNINSFVAGFASALACVALFQSIGPAMRMWWANFQGMGSMGMFLLMAAIGMGAWALGRQQGDGVNGRGSPGGGGGFGGAGAGAGAGARSGFGFGNSSAHSSPPPPNGEPPPGAGSAPPPRGAGGGPKASWQQQQQTPPPENGSARPETPKNSWERAREETRKREEERKAREAEQKRKEEAARRLREMREREQREREQREQREREQKERELKERQQRELREQREREQREKDAKLREEREREALERERLLQEARERELREKELRERLEREAREKIEQEARERMERESRERLERQARERLEREAREKVEREIRDRQERERRERETKERELREAREAREAREIREREERRRKEEEDIKNRKGSTYAFSSVGERTSMWPNGRPPAPSSQPGTPAAARAPSTATASSATKKPPGSTQEDAYSYRPYDKPRKPARKKSISDLSESSWAPSQSTARTTPPPSTRGPYTTKDPDKIVIKAVYGYVNQFAKTPASQLISGIGTVTDGLILRLTSEGLFIDDDVRGVAQREWDVKAWTLKLVEVWCPTHALNSAAASNPGAIPANHPFFKTMPAGTRRAPVERGPPKTLVGEEADTYLVEMLRACKDGCRPGLDPPSSPTCASSTTTPPSPSSASSVSGTSNSQNKTGEWRARGLHLLRATIRDQEGKRFLFVLSEEEAWKVALGLQRLRRGSQVRALGVTSFSSLESKNILETLGWG